MPYGGVSTTSHATLEASAASELLTVNPFPGVREETRKPPPGLTPPRLATKMRLRAVTFGFAIVAVPLVRFDVPIEAVTPLEALPPTIVGGTSVAEAGSAPVRGATANEVFEDSEPEKLFFFPRSIGLEFANVRMAFQKPRRSLRSTEQCRTYSPMAMPTELESFALPSCCKELSVIWTLST